MKIKLKAMIILMITLVLSGCQNIETNKTYNMNELSLETIELDHNWSEYVYINNTKYEYGTKLNELSHLGLDDNLELYIGVPVNDNAQREMEIRNELSNSNQDKSEATLRIEVKTTDKTEQEQYKDVLFEGLFVSAIYSTEKSNAGDGETTIGIGSTYDEVIKIMGEPKEILSESNFYKHVIYEDNGMKLLLILVQPTKDLISEENTKELLLAAIEIEKSM